MNMNTSLLRYYFKRIVFSQPKQFIFFPIIKLFFVIVYLPDPSIPIVIQKGILPYGLFWSFLNFPVYLNYSFWTTYLFGIDILFSNYIYRKISLKRFFLVQLYDIWLFADEFNNITVLWLTSFAIISPYFLILSIITKLPVTYCIPCINYALGPQGSWRFSSFPRLFSYSLILISWILVSIYWINKWHQSNKKQIH